jgi:hypothetical protein
VASAVVKLDGLPDVRARLNAMSEVASLRMLQPIVENRARPIQELARSLAPYRHGTLRAGIVLDLLKAGVGYCYFILTLTRKAYYGVFQEFGLGTGRKTGSMFARKTVKAHERYGRRRAAFLAGETKRMKNRYGEQHNMAMHPFFRPAVKFSRAYFIDGVLADIWAAVASKGAPS